MEAESCAAKKTLNEASRYTLGQRTDAQTKRRYLFYFYYSSNPDVTARISTQPGSRHSVGHIGFNYGLCHLSAKSRKRI